MSTRTRKKDVLRTFRITEEWNNILDEDAEEKGESVNTLINKILEKYVKWDRFTEKYPFVTVTRQGFKALFDEIDEIKLEKVTRDLSLRLPKDFQSFWFPQERPNIETFLEHHKLYAKYGRTCQVEYKNVGRDYTLSIYHELGEKFSKAQRIYLTEEMRSLFGIVPQIDITPNMIKVTFSASYQSTPAVEPRDRF